MFLVERSACLSSLNLHIYNYQVVRTGLDTMLFPMESAWNVLKRGIFLLKEMLISQLMMTERKKIREMCGWCGGTANN